MLLQNKTAVITGCNRGIGLAILERFAQNGATIIDDLAVKNQISIHPVFFDLENTDEIKNACREIHGLKLPVDILVNNAGIMYSGLFQMTTLDITRKVFNTNLFALITLTQYLSKLMIRQKSGCIINISSIAGMHGKSGLSIYGASKSAINTLTQSLATELKEYNIRVNAIAPGMTETDLISGIDSETIKSTLANADISRLALPSEIADTAVFLASEMASYITGQIIRVDGGQN